MKTFCAISFAAAAGLMNPVAAAAAAASNSDGNVSESAAEQCDAASDPRRCSVDEEAAPPAGGTCSLYLAPSSVPGAGLGIYTAVDISEGLDVGEPDDLYVPIADKFKTLPYRGQQRFLSWLGYVWPEAPDAFYHTYDEGTFPVVPRSFYQVDEGLNGATRGLYFLDGDDRVSAFAPGVASQVNSHPDFANVDKKSRSVRKDEAGLDGDDPGVGAFTPHHGVSFSATQGIPAGSELFINYGKTWHKRYDNKVKHAEDYESLEKKEIKNIPKRLPTEEEKRGEGRGICKKARKCVKEKECGDKEKTRDRQKCLMKCNRKCPEPDSDDEEDDAGGSGRDDAIEEEEIVQADTVRQVDWLKSNGICIDNIRAGRSTVPHAGRGAFAKNLISGGSLIAPAPLLALKRDDLVIYEADETQKYLRNVLNFDRVVGQELLLNYCYGHPDSPLLLLPYSPVVNFINHNGDEPNAEIRWPEGSSLRDPKEWLDLHPLDVVDQSGKLMMEFVALRDIMPGEEIFIDYGRDWEDAWKKHLETHTSSPDKEGAFDGAFRHEIGVPSGFCPDAWKHQSAIFELAPLESPLKPGELAQMTWAHNGKPIAQGLYRVGLPTGFSASLRKYSDDMGITSLYEKLIFGDDPLDDNDWYVFETHGEQWFAQRYNSRAWKFDMHYIAAWDEAARVSFLRALGQAGFDAALEGTGKFFGLDNITCFHASFMGLSECDNSFMHTDVYATGKKGFNFVYPLILVNGSKPELNIQSDDANIMIGVNYQYDVAYAMGDWGYHKTRAIEYEEEGQMRIVGGTYCSQIDDSNAAMMAHIYDGEDPAPFMEQFKLPIKEIHWGNGHSLPK